MSLAPNKKGYIACILFTRTPFSDCEVIHGFALDEHEALRLCNEAAKAAKWKPPAWWQWWRRKDSHKAVVGRDYGL